MSSLTTGNVLHQQKLLDRLMVKCESTCSILPVSWTWSPSSLGNHLIRNPEFLGILAHRTSEDDWSVQSPPKRKAFRFHAPILRRLLDQIGSLGDDHGLFFSKDPSSKWVSIGVQGWLLKATMVCSGLVEAVFFPGWEGIFDVCWVCWEGHDTKTKRCVQRICKNPNQSNPHKKCDFIDMIPFPEKRTRMLSAYSD